MKTLTLTLILALVAIAGYGQKPKQHVYHDTITTVKEWIDYAPDTIAVYFKELVWPDKNDDPKYRPPYEQWRSGYVVWQTYRKANFAILGAGVLTASGSYSITSQPDYYKDDFEESNHVPGIFLYEDKRRVTNKVLTVFKR